MELRQGHKCGGCQRRDTTQSTWCNQFTSASNLQHTHQGTQFLFERQKKKIVGTVGGSCGFVASAYSDNSVQNYSSFGDIVESIGSEGVIFFEEQGRS